MAASRAARGDTLGLVGVELHVLVVQLCGELVVRRSREREYTYPLIPVHTPQPHGDVIRSMSEGTIWIWLGCMNVPIRSWACGRPLELERCPYCQKDQLLLL